MKNNNKELFLTCVYVKSLENEGNSSLETSKARKWSLRVTKGSQKGDNWSQNVFQREANGAKGSQE